MKRLATCVLLLAGCTKGDPPGSAAPVPSAAAEPSVQAVVASAAPASTGVAHGESDLSLGEGWMPALRGKLVGHTSLVIRLEHADKSKSIFRASFREGPTRYRGEVAAYRLATTLGLGQYLAQADVASLSKARLRAGLPEPDHERFDATVLASDDGKVAGCAERWIDGLEMPPFEKEPWVSKWKGWLQGGAAPTPEEEPLAAQFSTLVAFDYLTGNFDRWSGGNLGAVKKNDLYELRYIDNDGAFLEPMPKAPLAANKQRLLATQRFSRKLVTALRGITDWAAVFGKGLDHEPLLPAKVVDGVKARAAEVLAQADAHPDAPFP